MTYLEAICKFLITLRLESRILQHSQVEFEKHHEGWIYLRATFDSERKIDCRFSGDRPISVDLCVEVR